MEILGERWEMAGKYRFLGGVLTTKKVGFRSRKLGDNYFYPLPPTQKSGLYREKSGLDREN